MGWATLASSTELELYTNRLRNGGTEVAAMINGERVSMTYYGYSERECRAEFRLHVVSLKRRGLL